MSDSARLFVIVNHAAARARRAWPAVREALAAGGVAFDVHESSVQGETEERTRAALVEGYGTIAVVGGDGTLSAAAAGYFQSLDELKEGETPGAVNPAAAIAVLPAGTGDDFARGLSAGRPEPLDAWVRRLVTHCLAHRESPTGRSTTRGVDVLLGSTDGGGRRFVCLNAATLGIGAEVAGRVAAQGGAVRRLSGKMRFACAAAQALAAWRGRLVRIQVDEGEWKECRTNLVVVANGAYAGGGMNFSPSARIDDGLLDVLSVCGITRLELVRELARVHRGGHLANPKVTLARGQSVRIEATEEGGARALEADGDVRGSTPVELRVLPAALRVVMPD
jgi:diacylglycerol kinase family enzyme